MSQLVLPTLSTVPSFDIGYRLVGERGPDGKLTLRQIPLSQADILFPMEDDRVSVSDWHVSTLMYLLMIFRHHLRHERATLVHSDQQVDFGISGIGNPAPDLIVYRNARDPHKNWSTFPVVEQGAEIVMALEIVSPKNRDTDVRVKPVIYHAGGIPTYVIVDQAAEDGPRVLRCLRDGGERYREEPVGPRGLELEEIGLRLALEDNDLVCYDMATGARYENYEQTAEAKAEAVMQATGAKRLAAKAMRKAEAEQKKAESAELKAKTAELKAKTAELKAKTAEEKIRQEADARAAAEERIRELEDRLRRLESKRRQN